MEGKDKLIEYWLKASEEDLDVATNLLNLKKYTHSLFFGHLSLEKILKALYINIMEDYPPKTHNLILLAKNINIEITEEIEKQLIEINSFNMEARYPDEKFKFYKKCTKSFTTKYLTIIMEISKWLKMKL